MRKNIKHYVSEADRLLKEHKILKPKTDSEIKEIEKAKKISQKRDDQNSVIE